MVTETSQLWYMNLYPGERKDKKGDTSFNLCLTKGIVAIGWYRLNQHIRTSSPKKYAESAQTIIPNEYLSRKDEFGKWRRQFEMLGGMKNGDLVWTKRSRGHFYLNRILDSEVALLYGRDFSQNDFGSARRCDWNEVFDDLAVPAEVKRNTRGTIHRIKDPEGKAVALSELLYNEIKGVEVFRPRELRAELFDYLAPGDVEDLVGLFLQAKKNLLIVPSSSKQSTSPVEFLMIDRETGEQVGVQVKTGKQSIKLEDYRDAPERMYFFQQKSKPPVSTDKKRIFIEDKELLDFARDNPTQLPAGIRRLVKRLAGE